MLYCSLQPYLLQTHAYNSLSSDPGLIVSATVLMKYTGVVASTNPAVWATKQTQHAFLNILLIFRQSRQQKPSGQFQALHTK